VTKQSRSNSLEIDRDCHASFHLARNDMVFLDHLRNSPISFWIDSSGGPEKLCKQSFFSINPKYYLYGSLNEITLEDCETGAISYVPGNCFNTLEEKLKEEKKNKNGIFVGYVSYDLFKANLKAISYPDFFFAFFDNYSTLDPNLSAFSSQFSACNPLTSCLLPLASNMSDEEYLEKVKQIKKEIKAGNVYQVNLTREYSIETTDNRQRTTALDLYLRLREVSPNPYGCFFKTPFVSILSSSPEEFLYIGPVTGDKGQETTDQGPETKTHSSILTPQSYIIRTRPIKGTLPKGVFEIDPKNKAENLMIVDLERNDLGRICKPGTIKVNELLNIEEYKHLNHVVSSIEGKLKNNITLKEIFEATFPGGSITGAPKIAAMKIIDELEPTPRGAYTGSFGYIKTDGTMNFNILIRTIFVQSCLSLRAKRSNPDRDCFVDTLVSPRNDKFRVTFNVGGGIVADSDPHAELEEIKLKAKGIINSIGLDSL